MKIVLPEIETSRLLLRQFTPEHLNDLFLVRLDPDVMKFITGVPPRENWARQASQNICTAGKYLVLGIGLSASRRIRVCYAGVAVAIF